MKKNKPIIISLEMFPYDVLFWFGDDAKRLKKTLIKYNVDKKEVKKMFEGTTFSARTMIFGNNGTVVWIKKTDNIHGLLAHEIFHAVIFIMNRAGVYLSDYSEETFAYAVGYLTEKIYKHIDR